MKKYHILDKQGNGIFPITHVNAVIDNNGNPLDSIIGSKADASDVEQSEAFLQTEITQNATSIASHTQTLSNMQDAIDALDGNTVEVVADHTGVSTPDVQVIYREPEDATDPTYYIDWMWDGTAWKEIKKSTTPIENVPTKGSDNIPKSGGVFNAIQNDAVYDISVHTTAEGGELASYINLADALGYNGGNVPADYRAGGMSVKFAKLEPALFNVVVRNEATAPSGATMISADEDALATDTGVYSRNSLSASFTSLPTTIGDTTVCYYGVSAGVIKVWEFTKLSDDTTHYEQYRLMSPTWSTAVSDWQGVDKVPTYGSHSLIESDYVAVMDDRIRCIENLMINKSEYIISDENDAYISSANNYRWASGRKSAFIDLSGILTIDIHVKESGNARIAFLKNNTITVGNAASFSDEYPSMIDLSSGVVQSYNVHGSMNYLYVYTDVNSYVPEKIETEGFFNFSSLKPLYNKTVILCGDSQVNQSNSSFEKTIIDRTGATVLKCGFGGCRMAWREDGGASAYDAFTMVNVADCLVSGDYTSMESALDEVSDSYKSLYTQSVNALKSLTPQVLGNGDGFIMTIAYGSNDYSGGNILGDPDELNKRTVLGAMQYSIETLLTAYPKLQLIFVGLPYRVYDYETIDGQKVVTSDSDTYTKTIGGTTYHRYDYSDAILENSARNHLPCFDMYRKCGRTKYNAFIIGVDGAHPTTEYGGKLAGELYVKLLTSF